MKSLLSIYLRAGVVAAGAGNATREIPLSEFFLGPRRTVLTSAEMITQIRVARTFREWRGRQMVEMEIAAWSPPRPTRRGPTEPTAYC